MRVMLCLFSSLCGLLLPACVQAQPDTLWTARVRQAGSVTVSPVFYGATSLLDSSFVVVGVADPSASYTDMLAARINEQGEVLWCRTLGAAAFNEVASAVLQTADGTIVVVGYGGTGTTPNLLMIWGLSVNGDSLWSRSYTGGAVAQANDARLLPDGNIIITGYRQGADLQQSDLWLLKCAPNGDTLWTRMYGGAGTDVGNAVIGGSDGRLMIAGSSTSFGTGDYDVWLLITNGVGNLLSSATTGTSSSERCYGMASDGGVVWIAGRTAAGGSANAYLVKADSSGAVEWARSFSVGRADEQFRALRTLDIGGVLCVGWAGTTAAMPEPWIADVTSDGTLQSLWIGDDFQQGQLYGICSVSNGGFLICGTIMEGGVRKGYLIRMGSEGGVSGIVTSVETHDPMPGVYIGVTSEAHYAITDAQGQFRLLLNAGTYDLVLYGPCVTSDTVESLTVWRDSLTWLELVAAQPDFEVRQTSINVVVHNRIETVWPLTIYNHGAGAMDFSVQAHAQIPEGGWLSVSPGQGVVPPTDSVVVSVLVNASTPDDGTYDYYGYIEVHAHSCPDSTRQIPVLVTVLDLPQRAGLPMADALQPAYPNPFNALTRLSYSLAHAARIRLTVYDVTGRAVQTLVDGLQEGGRHEILFDGTRLASGVYLVRMESGTFAATTKLLLLK